MASCKDCLHYELCQYNTYQEAHYFGKDKEIYITIKNNSACKFFKPTADVVEVKHGYWKDRYNNKYDNHLYECSVCGREALYKIYANELCQTKTRQALTPACPYCTAKMDGGADNGNTVEK